MGTSGVYRANGIVLHRLMHTTFAVERGYSHLQLNSWLRARKQRLKNDIEAATPPKSGRWRKKSNIRSDVASSGQASSLLCVVVYPIFKPKIRWDFTWCFMQRCRHARRTYVHWNLIDSGAENKTIHLERNWFSCTLYIFVYINGCGCHLSYPLTFTLDFISME